MEGQDLTPFEKEFIKNLIDAEVMNTLSPSEKMEKETLIFAEIRDRLGEKTASMYLKKIWTVVRNRRMQGLR